MNDASACIATTVTATSTAKCATAHNNKTSYIIHIAIMILMHMAMQ